MRGVGHEELGPGGIGPLAAAGLNVTQDQHRGDQLGAGQRRGEHLAVVLIKKLHAGGAGDVRFFRHTAMIASAASAEPMAPAVLRAPPRRGA